MDVFYYNERKYQIILERSAKGLDSWMYMRAYTDNTTDNFLYVTFLYNIKTGDTTIDFDLVIKEMLYSCDDLLFHTAVFELHEPSIWLLAISSINGLFSIDAQLYKEDSDFIKIVRSEILTNKEEFERHIKKAIIDNLL